MLMRTKALPSFHLHFVIAHDMPRKDTSIHVRHWKWSTLGVVQVSVVEFDDALCLFAYDAFTLSRSYSFLLFVFLVAISSNCRDHMT